MKSFVRSRIFRTELYPTGVTSSGTLALQKLQGYPLPRQCYKLLSRFSKGIKDAAGRVSHEGGYELCVQPSYVEGAADRWFIHTMVKICHLRVSIRQSPLCRGKPWVVADIQGGSVK